MKFARTHCSKCSCGLFEFTPRNNTILNIGGVWFALMFLRIFCKELELSYFVVQPHGFKRKLDEVFKVFRDMGQSLANAILLTFQRLSCKGIHENVNACCERIFAGSWIEVGCLC